MTNMKSTVPFVESSFLFFVMIQVKHEKYLIHPPRSYPSSMTCTGFQRCGGQTLNPNSLTESGMGMNSYRTFST